MAVKYIYNISENISKIYDCHYSPRYLNILKLGYINKIYKYI